MNSNKPSCKTIDLEAEEDCSLVHKMKRTSKTSIQKKSISTIQKGIIKSKMFSRKIYFRFKNKNHIEQIAAIFFGSLFES